MSSPKIMAGGFIATSSLSRLAKITPSRGDAASTGALSSTQAFAFRSFLPPRKLPGWDCTRPAAAATPTRGAASWTIFFSGCIFERRDLLFTAFSIPAAVGELCAAWTVKDPFSIGCCTVAWAAAGCTSTMSSSESSSRIRRRRRDSSWIVANEAPLDFGQGSCRPTEAGRDWSATTTTGGP
ncbi:unnamed protein product [Linum trigynum]|uniref:Uncharacterized protein n=1 Tax=Linum trigynum TaxID=586398 RepID=A0AAV2CUB7_9ROSI